MSVADEMYEVIDLGANNLSTSIFPHGMNNLGQVAAYTFDASSSFAIVYNDGVMADLGHLGFQYSMAQDINDSGQVVGRSATVQQDSGYGSRSYDNKVHGFIYNDGTMHDIGTLGGNYSNAFAINKLGQVVGESHTSPDYNSLHAILYDNGTLQDIGTLGGYGWSTASGINDCGQIVGQSNGRAFLYDNGIMKDLGTLGGSESSAIAINNLGQIVGYSRNIDGDNEAFLYVNGTMNNLEDLISDSSIDLSIASDINELGQIIVQSSSRGFLFNPTQPIEAPCFCSTLISLGL